MKSTFQVGLLTTLGIATERTAADRRRLIALEAPSVFFLPSNSRGFFFGSESGTELQVGCIYRTGLLVFFHAAIVVCLDRMILLRCHILVFPRNAPRTQGQELLEVNFFHFPFQSRGGVRSLHDSTDPVARASSYLM